MIEKAKAKVDKEVEAVVRIEVDFDFELVQDLKLLFVEELRKRDVSAIATELVPIKYLPCDCCCCCCCCQL